MSAQPAPLARAATRPLPPVHHWLQPQNVSFLPGFSAPPLEQFAAGLSEAFRRFGHMVDPTPNAETSAIFATAEFGVPLNWRKAPLFTARRNFGLAHSPTIFTVLHATPAQLRAVTAHFERVLPTHPPRPQDYDFAGLSPTAYKTLYEQGNRGGPLMALARLMQSQSKSIRLLLVVGEGEPQYAYIFDLVGAHPKISAADPQAFYAEIALRLATTLSTEEITNHQILAPPIPAEVWRGLDTPRAMQTAAAALGRRHFFTEMVRINNLVAVPSIADTVANQYSEGCFATWEPRLQALIATVTGSARPVEKDAITENDLAVIVGVREGGGGALVRHVTGKQNDSPSSESVEMMDMDSRLPRLRLEEAWGISEPVPVIRSKLHGHRGIGGYDPRWVEFVPLEEPYYHYPVSCATDSQARGIVNAFARAQSLLNPADPRLAAFTVLPGHGVVITEKWALGKQPFELICELMDSGALRVENNIPQGFHTYEPAASSQMRLCDPLSRDDRIAP
jgi:hypothetical protein